MTLNKNFRNSPNIIKIGIVGGGQLGRMMILEGKKLGIKFIILDPDENCPSSSIADEQIVGGYYDADKIQELAKRCDVLTYELEHINADVLIDLTEKGYKIQPSPNSLKMIQNKYRQKSFLKTRNISTTEFEKINSIEDIKDYIRREGLPVILKSCYGGYDGKGNKLIRTLDDIEDGYKLLDGANQELMIEKYIHFTHEISVITARGANGDIKIYPFAENIHEDNILRTTIVPARVNNEVARNARDLALKVMRELDGTGVFCIEMFVDKNNQVLVNEIAPRVHNSGHYTLDGCNVSQFEQHLRAILEYPLANAYLIKPSVMINLLGEDTEGRALIQGLEPTLQDSDVYVHFYGKEYNKPLRKMGHVTLLGEDVEQVLRRAEKIRNTLKITSC